VAREAYDPSRVAIEPTPWERRRSLGFLPALWLTWRDSVFRPVEFFRRLPPQGGLGPALGYLAIVSALGFFFSLYWGTVEGVLRMAGGGGLAVQLLGSLLSSLLILAFLLPFYVGLLFVAVAVLHLGFMVAGAGRRGYEATFRAIAYASGPMAFWIFPFFGSIVSGAWGMVIAFIAVREVQRTTNGRAALGFLLPVLALVVLGVIVAILFALLLSQIQVGQPV
jgi:hypothetical protein